MQPLKERVTEALRKALEPMGDKDGYILPIYTVKDVAESISEAFSPVIFTAIFERYRLSDRLVRPDKKDVIELRDVCKKQLDDIVRSLEVNSPTALLIAITSIQSELLKLLGKIGVLDKFSEIIRLYLDNADKKISDDDLVNKIREIIKSKI